MWEPTSILGWSHQETSISALWSRCTELCILLNIPDYVTLSCSNTKMNQQTSVLKQAAFILKANVNFTEHDIWALEWRSYYIITSHPWCTSINNNTLSCPLALWDLFWYFSEILISLHDSKQYGYIEMYRCWNLKECFTRKENY